MLLSADLLAARHRSAFLDRMEDGDVALFPGASLATRNHDVDFPFRQESNFWYLTGCPEPDAWLVLAKGIDGLPEAELFVLPRDRSREIWNGRRLGPAGAREVLGFPAARESAEFPAAAGHALALARRAWVRLGAHAGLDAIVRERLEELRRRVRTGVEPPEVLLDPTPTLGELRLHKAPEELAWMRRAAAVTAEAHLLAMAMTAPGRHEYEVEALLDYVFRRNGGDGAGWAYPPIVAGGANACILHYQVNADPLRAGDLLLVDAGAEFGHYACDVTRTWPVSGRFEGPGRRLYEVVLAAQEAAIARCRVGVPFSEVHDVAVRTLCEGLIEVGLLRGSLDEVVESGGWRRFYPHNTSHWLGLDVHDAGRYLVDGESRPLEAGMVLTVEPGLYVQPDDEEAPEEFRGIGVRIEDDVHVTGDEPEVLTAAVVKEVDAVEDACAQELEALPSLDSPLSA